MTADIALPVGASVSGRLQLGKRVLCRAARKKQVAEGATTRISCTFPARYLKARKSGAKSSQTPTPTQQQYAKLIISVSLAALAKDAPPVVLAIPLALWSLVATSNG